MAGVPRPCDVDGHGEREAAVTERPGGGVMTDPKLRDALAEALPGALDYAIPTAYESRTGHVSPGRLIEYILAHPAVIAALDTIDPAVGLREAAENVSDRRTLMDDGFWVSRKEMRALDLALGREDIGEATATGDAPETDGGA